MLHLFGKPATVHRPRPAMSSLSGEMTPPCPHGPSMAVPRSAARGGGETLDRPDRRIWAVADAIGTRAADAAAAVAVIDALAALADACAPDPVAIRALLGRVDDAVRAARPDRRRSAGASVAMIRLDDHVATVLWAGDCRAYRYRDGTLDLLTRDHSALHELIDAGVPVPARAGAHPHLVTRAIGLGPGLAIESVTVRVAAGDRLLLCARGLPSIVPATMIAARLRMTAAAAADALVEATSCAGGAGDAPLVAIELR